MDEYRSALHLDNLGKFLTPINFAFGGLTILCGHWSIRLGFSLIEFAFFSGFFRLVLAAFFTYFLGLLLIAGDIPQFAFMQQHCKFLTMTLGRGVFNIFTGAWVYSLMATGTGFQAVLGWIDFVVTFIYFMTFSHHFFRDCGL